jgi:formamidopyrimidine-DNA glycosylase
MPELPEVETVKRTLNELVAGKTIARVTVRLARIIRRPLDTERFAAELVGQRIHEVTRRAKFLRLVLDDYALISHLRMEGRYGMFRAADPLDKHTHVIFHFTDGSELRYTDVRQFGTMHLFPLGAEFVADPLVGLGVEPLTEQFTLRVLTDALAKRSAPIKPLLLNQKYIVGLGNIYVDESLFKAQIHPLRPANSLKRAEWVRLHEAIRATLQEAVDAGGTSVKSYVNGQGEMGMFQQQLLAYGRDGDPCTRCAALIVKSVVGGRGTHVCPHCQKPPLIKRRIATKAGERQ